MRTRDVIDVLIEEYSASFNMPVPKKYKSLFVKIYSTMVTLELEKRNIRSNSKEGNMLKEVIYKDIAFFGKAICFTLKLVHEIQNGVYFFRKELIIKK